MSRILLVDDFVSIRNALHSLLVRHGYSCVEADDGAQALTYLHQEPFDLVITDNHMPILGGIGLLESLSHLVEGPRPPVILLSGQLDHDTRKQALLAGAWMVLEKPYVFSELLAAIRLAVHPPIHPVSFIP